MLNGKVLWFDERDGYGVILGNDGRKYYTDVSAIPSRACLRAGQNVNFVENLAITSALCAIVKGN